jgi:cytidine deaminase
MQPIKEEGSGHRSFLLISSVYDGRMDWSSMTSRAWETRDHAHAPYSQFFVGAAVIDAENRIFTGCNVENLSFGLTICAERVAISCAIAAGCRNLQALVVVADTDTPVSPCGACRQVMAEFGIAQIRLCNRHEFLDFSLEQLLPRSKAGILHRTE